MTAARVLHHDRVPVGVAASPGPTLPAVLPDAPCRSSVLGWESFSLVSVLVLGGSALLGCRRTDRRADDETMVLLIGEDERADRARALLEGWRARGTELALRPAGVNGAIEVYDQARSALRAHLLTA